MGSHLPQTQRAAQWIPATKSIEINTIAVPQPSPTQLLVKTVTASLCHSDLMHFDASLPHIADEKDPVTMGHECSGTVVALGADVVGFQLGDHVGVFPVVGCCFECAGCQVHNLYCETGKTAVPGFGVDGYFQEYSIVEQNCAIVLPEKIPVEIAAPIFCAGITSWNGVRNSELKKGEWLAIVGCGGLGHLGIQYAKAMGYRVIGIDVMDGPLEEAKAQGADHVFNPQKNSNYVAEIKALTKGGCHAVVNFTASKVAYDSSLAVLRTNGAVTVVGIPSQPVSFDPLALSTRKYRVLGGSNGIPQQLPELVEFTAKHGILPHVTFYPLEQLSYMIELLQSGKVKGRLAVRF